MVRMFVAMALVLGAFAAGTAGTEAATCGVCRPTPVRTAAVVTAKTVAKTGVLATRVVVKTPAAIARGAAHVVAQATVSTIDRFDGARCAAKARFDCAKARRAARRDARGWQCCDSACCTPAA